MLALLAKRRELSGDTFRIKVVEMLADRDRVVVICIVSAERFGQYWSAPALHLWRVRSEKATDVCEFQLDQHGEEEFWPRSPLRTRPRRRRDGRSTLAP